MFILTLLLLLQNSPAPCAWGNAMEIGVLDPAIRESSGMAVSRRIPNRTYRHNDSGDGGRFYVMDIDGGNVKAVTIDGFTPTDVEDMALGPCDAAADCLFVADIGDNSSNRSNLEIVAVEELAEFPGSVQPRHRIRIRYPDGPHDAEALAVHPADGSLYIITKDPASPGIYRLSRERWLNASGRIETLELVLTLDWAALLPNTLPFTRPATSMDIASDGNRFIVLNYIEAVEFFIDLSGVVPDPATWAAGRHYRRVPLTTLEQQEAIAYLPDGNGFLYDTERAIPTRPARIMQVVCGN